MSEARGLTEQTIRDLGELLRPLRTRSAKVPAFVPYEVPLRPGVTARLVLPVDLTEAEADRLCAVIISLAFGELSTATCEKRQED